MKTRILTRISLLLLLVATFSSQTDANTVKITLPAGTYPTISAGYSAAADNATIMLQGIEYIENLSFVDVKTVLLAGGYNPDFTQNAGYSTVRGTLKVSRGTVQVQKIVVRDAGTVPDAPTAVAATAGNMPNTVIVSFDTPNSSSPISGYSVVSIPGGISGAGTASPITVSCPTTCAGYAFSVAATNASGDSLPSAPADVITSYNVTETFHEPQTQPNNSIFIGSFTFNATTGTVSNLHGLLSESMTGKDANGVYHPDQMTWLPLTIQLSSISNPTIGGLLVTTFKNPNTNTFWTGTGGDGWSPQAGVAVGGVYNGFPVAANNPGNAYAMVFVNTADPTAPLTQTQIDKLAYADCAPGGMMGAVCMTGTSLAGYGTVGTMGGYPVSQVITKQ